MSEERNERWAISESELPHLAWLKSDDELIGTFQDTDDESRPVGDLHQVVVLRNGTVTNRNRDGTVGVVQEVRDAVESEDTLYHPTRGPDGAPGDDYEGETTLKWVDVVVDEDGNFLWLADETPAPTP